MKTITIHVPDMQSAHCQTSVSNAIKTIEGVQIRHQEAGKISVSIEADNLENEVVQTIEKAGYSVEPGSNNNA